MRDIAEDHMRDGGCTRMCVKRENYTQKMRLKREGISN